VTVAATVEAMINSPRFKVLPSTWFVADGPVIRIATVSREFARLTPKAS